MTPRLLRTLTTSCIAAVVLFSGCKPRLDSPDAGERCRAVAAVNDPAILARIAQNDPAEEVRGAAVAKLGDQEILAKIALADRSDRVVGLALERLKAPDLLARVATGRHDNVGAEVGAVQNIDDPGVLARLVTADCDEPVRGVALDRIHDPPALARIASETRSEKIRDAALARITDPPTLAGFAIASHDPSVGRSLVERLSDQPQIARVAIETTHASIADLAMGKVSDEGLIARILIEARIFTSHKPEEADEGPRFAAWNSLLEQLSDPSALAAVAIESVNGDIAEAARRKLSDPAALARVAAHEERLKAILATTDQAELAKLAAQERNRNLRLAALGRLSAQDVVSRIAQNDPDPVIRGAAVGGLEDGAVLAKVALGDADTEVRASAVARLTDAAMLARIARDDPEPAVRVVAVNELVRARAGVGVLREIVGRDPDASVRRATLEGLSEERDLVAVATGDRDPELRVAAIGRISSQTALGGIAQEDPAPMVRIAAVQKLADPSILGRIAGNDKDAAVREAAIGRVDDPAVLDKSALEDPAGEVRAAAVKRVKDPAVLRKAAIEDKEPRVRSAAAGRIEDAGTLAKIALDDESRIVREAAIAVMDRFGEPMMRLMQAALLTGRPAAKANACDALVHFKQRALPGLRTALDNPSADTRRYAAEALGRLEDRSAAKALAAHLSDSDEGVRRNSADAVGKLGETGAGQVLPMLSAADAGVRKYVLFILARSEGLKDTAPVAALLTNDRETRWYAAHLLLTTEAPVDPALDAVRKLLGSTKYSEAAAAGPAGIALCSAKLADWEAGPAVADVLAKAGWKPAGECERILYAIARRDRGELTRDWATTERLILEHVQLGDDAMIKNGVYGAIGCGETSSVPELIRILFASGTKEMAETYLNCGEGQLEEAARTWASEHGYSILPMGGSSPVSWGGL